MAMSNQRGRFLAGLIIMAAVADAAAAQDTHRPSQRRSADAPLKVGDEAPDFTLKSPDGTEEFALADLRGTKPVILFFGSYT